MNNYDKIPKELKELKQWVCARDDNKIPMRAFENLAASSTDKSTWSDFETALNAVNNGLYDYCGFVFREENGYVGIDIDDGFDEDDFITPLGADIINHCQSYTEKSRSGRGFHIILKGDLSFKGKNNLKGVEIYKTSRYFILTGNMMFYDSIIENQEAIDYIVDKYFDNEPKISKNKNFTNYKIYRPDWGNPVKGHKIKVKPSYPEIKNGSRNTCLSSLAGSMHKIGYSKKHIYHELSKVNAKRCNPTISINELKSICNSITRYVRD